MRGRTRAIVQWTVAVAGLGVLAWQLPALVGEGGRLAGELADLRWGWIGLAVLLGIGALVLYGELHRRLLAAGGARLSVRSVQAINFAENALSTTLPAVGNAAGFVYATYQLRRRHVEVALAAWSLMLAGTVSTIVVILLAVLGAGITGRVPVLVAVLVVLGLLLATWACWRAVNSAPVLRRCLRWLVRLGRHLPAFLVGSRTSAVDPDSVSQRVSDRIGLLRPSGGGWVLIIGCAALSWAMDFLSLYASVAAVGHPAPWPALALGFVVVQISIALQLFPGGAGIAEAGLLGVLIASGVPVAPAVAGTLVYRLINWLGLAAIGWVVYAVQIHLMSPPQQQLRARGSPSREPETGSCS
ncbi:UPF0104 family protein [Saccharopolyspora rhizosphaerae]|uniref:UPF0104 family protein n=1 Tax=Saccharopolyspora rhizosphaerae TaxID=2492662 RepID=A0A426JLN8_9PSEU|nr:lysylphosphatidylglycerol synthase transmembrane domain-containing protein [Saccharopolyspora rhizosphaerae]RRO14096.1 UPF0104 family protein [Saccharopolyspora rhizosphaerae]